MINTLIIVIFYGDLVYILDDYVIPVDFDETFKNGQANPIQLLTGWNADDNVSFGGSLNPAQFKELALEKYGSKTEEYLRLFPAENEEELNETRNTISELMFGYQNSTWAKIQSELAPGSSYLYYFTRVPPGDPNYGAFHSAEFSYAFHTLKYWDRPFESVDDRLENIMSEYWVNFVKTGNPNGGDLPEWPVYSNRNPQAMELGVNVGPISLPHLEQIRFMQSIYLK